MHDSDLPLPMSTGGPIPHATIMAVCGAALLSASACNSPISKEISQTGYPTQARVEYVLQCMEKNGGQNYDSMYPCVCSIDKIASQLSYEDFSEAQTFTYMRNAPGEAGGLFRDPPRAKELRQRLKDAESFAQKNCFVKPSKSGSETSASR